MVRVLYTIFLALLLAFFVGYGIEVFYPTPTYPTYPAELQPSEKAPAQMTADEKRLQTDYDKKVEAYNKEFKEHSKNTSLFALGFSLILLILSLTLFINVEIFTEGFLLGGLLTLLYGIIRSFTGDDQKFSFLMTSIGLVIAFFLGWFKFIRPKKTS